MSDQEKKDDEPKKKGLELPTERIIGESHELLRVRDLKSKGAFLDDRNSRVFRNRKETLTKFLIRGKLNETTKNNKLLRSVTYSYKSIEDQSPRPLKLITKDQIEAFKKAAKEFYDQALPNTEIPEYEKDLRRYFKLPDPDLEPDCYIAYGPLHNPSFAVLWGCEKKEKTSLPLAPHPILDNTELKEGPTVLEKLEKRIPPWRKWAIWAGTAAGAAAVLMLFLWLRRDKEPPEITKITAENVPTRVLVEFNEKLNPKSVVTESFSWIDENGLKLEKADLNPEDAKQVILTTTAMESGPKYVLSATGIKDRAGNLVNEGTEQGFVFEDTLAPEFKRASGDGGDRHKLHLVFNEKLERQSAESPQNYKISNMRVNKATLVKDNPNMVTVEFNKEFTEGERYEIDIQSLRDASTNRNAIEEPKTHSFKYIDSLPPEVEKVTAEGQQLEVLVHFNEPLEKNSAEDYTNFEIGVPGDKNITVKIAELQEDSRTVKLTLGTPIYRDIVYELYVSGVRDMATLPSSMTQREDANATFRYTGNPDERPPQLEKAELNNTSKVKITITYDEPVTDSALNNNGYAIVNKNPAGASPPGVKEVQAVESDASKVVLVLTKPLNNDNEYQLFLKENVILDRFGNQLQRPNPDGYPITKFTIVTGGPNPGKLKGRATISRDNRSKITFKVYAELDKVTAENPANYKVLGLQVLKAELISPKEVIINLNAALPLNNPAPLKLKISGILMTGDAREYGPQILDVDLK